MKLFDTVLVTGCSNGIGQSIGAILKDTNIANRVLGCDIHSDHPGHLFFDYCEKIPKANDECYFEAIGKICHRFSIDLIIPTIEVEIARFVNQGSNEYFEGIPVLLANEKAIRIGLDKLETANFLKSQGLPYPWTNVVGKEGPNDVPCVLKMRSGQRSKNFIIVEDWSSIPLYTKVRPEDIWQELLLPASQEYTCGVYRSVNDDIRTLAIRRKLVGGLTGMGETIDDKSVTDYLRQIATSMDLRGSVNVQLRVTDRGPVAFEINPRFSSTVRFRHLLGFQDLIWSILEIKKVSLDPYMGVPPGIRIYRGGVEYIF